MSTHVEHISRRMATTSPQYRNVWVGMKVLHTKESGRRVEGTITGWAGPHPVATFPDGSWARLGLKIEVVP